MISNQKMSLLSISKNIGVIFGVSGTNITRNRFITIDVKIIVNLYNLNPFCDMGNMITPT